MKRLKLTATSHTTIPNDQWETGFDAIESLDNAISEGIISDDSELCGDLSVPTANPDAVERVNAQFPDLIRTNDNFIQFDDKEVAKVINNKSGKNLPLSVSDARSITSLSTWFAENRDIKSFKALSQFTGITSLVFKSFYNCTNLEYLVLPPNVTTLAAIGGSNNGYFGGCSNLKVLDLNNVASMGQLVFSNETTPTNIETLIVRKPIYFAYNCYALSKLSINKIVFADILTLLSCTFGSGNAAWGFGRTISVYLLSDLSSPLTSVTIPSSVTTINQFIFNNCRSLITVNLNNVTTIKAYAFKSCSSLANIDMHNVTSMGEESFRDCISLGRVDISKVTSLGYNAFYGCTNVIIEKLNDAITTISGGTFYGCSKLQLTSLPKNLTSIAADAFRNAATKLNCKLPDSLTTLTNSYALALASAEYIHSNNVTTLCAGGSSLTVGSCDGVILYSKKIQSCVNDTGFTQFNRGVGASVVILEEGIGDVVVGNSGFWLNSNYNKGLLKDFPSNTYATGVTVNMAVAGAQVDYWVFRMPTLTLTGLTSAKKYIFVHQGATTNTDSRIKLIGGSEWAAAMKEVHDMYVGKWFNRCSNPTSSGYTSTYDNQFHPWSDEWADYDIFGVDRPS